MTGRLEGIVAQSREALLALCDASIESIVLHRDGVILACNDATCRMFGYSSDELVGRSVLELASPDYVDHVRANYESGLGMTYQAWGLRKDGVRFRAEVRARNVRLGESELVRAVVLRDLSERDKADRQLAATISLLRATLDSTADGILVVDSNGRITLYNERFLTICGIPALMVGDLDERSVSFVEKQLVDPYTFRARIAALYKAPETETIDTLEFLDGRIVERYSRPQRIGNTIIGRVWSFRDVTSQRRAERTLELAVQMRDEFLGIASHELFTPITSLAVAIRGLRELAEARPSDASEDRRVRLFSNAERQVQRLARLVQELLDVTKIDGGRMDLVIEDVDLRAVAGDALERFAIELDRDHITATLDAPSPVIGRWDRARLEQVVTNLLSNAMKFGRGTPIELSVRLVDNRAQLVVRDHGIGIEPDQQAYIFERFRRAVSSRHFAGLGLGLYITRQIVEAHGGALTLVSERGKGSEFTVQLPIAERGAHE